MPVDLPEMQIFISGHYKGKDYSPEFVRSAYRNWQKFSTLRNSDGSKFAEPPAWLGHEELPELAGRTDLPALGDFDNIRIQDLPDGRVAMWGRPHQIHDDLAKWINERKTRKVSAEFYENWHDSKGVAHGPVLRRVGFLGATPPEVKELNTFPAFKNLDGSAKYANTPALAFDDKQPTFTIDIPITFSDGGSSIMDRKQTEQMLKGIAKQKGVTLSDATLKLMDDKAVAQLLLDWTTEGAKDGADPNAPPADPAKMSDAITANVLSKFSDTLTKALEPITKRLDSTDAALVANRNAEKGRTVDELLAWATGKNPQKETRYKPSQVPLMRSRLMASDDVNKTVKLSDADGKNERDATPFELACEEIRRAPVIHKFSDDMPVPTNGEDDEVKRAKEYAEKRNKQIAKQRA
jgi:hypothetical protein